MSCPAKADAGGSSGGVARTLAERGRSDVGVIGHCLIRNTRAALVDGSIGAVFHTDPDT